MYYLKIWRNPWKINGFQVSGGRSTEKDRKCHAVRYHSTISALQGELGLWLFWTATDSESCFFRLLFSGPRYPIWRFEEILGKSMDFQVLGISGSLWMKIENAPRWDIIPRPRRCRGSWPMGSSKTWLVRIFDFFVRLKVIVDVLFEDLKKSLENQWISSFWG